MRSPWPPPGPKNPRRRRTRGGAIRLTELTRHFKIPTVLCINKWDLNPELALQMEHEAERGGIRVVGKIHYDPSITKAQIAGQSLVEFQNGDLAGEFKELWRRVHELLA